MKAKVSPSIGNDSRKETALLKEEGNRFIPSRKKALFQHPGRERWVCNAERGCSK